MVGFNASHHLLPVLGLLLATRCQGLAGPNTLLNKIQSQIQGKPAAEAPKSLLERLDLVDKSEPKTFAFKLNQIPDLLTASLPVSDEMQEFEYH